MAMNALKKLCKIQYFLLYSLSSKQLKFGSMVKIKYFKIEIMKKLKQKRKRLENAKVLV